MSGRPVLPGSRIRSALRALPIVERPCRYALELTLEQLRLAGRFEPVDAARVAVVQSLADAVDVDPMDARLATAYRAALEALLDDPSDDAISDLVSRFERAAEQGSATVRDSSAG